MKRTILAAALVVLAGANTANAQLFGRFNPFVNNDATLFATDSNVALENDITLENSADAYDADNSAPDPTPVSVNDAMPMTTYYGGGMGLLGANYFNPGESQSIGWGGYGGHGGHGDCGCNGHGGYGGAGLWSGYCADRHRHHGKCGRGHCGGMKMPHLNRHGCGHAPACNDRCGAGCHLPKFKMPKFDMLHGCKCGGCETACGRGHKGCGWNLFAGFNLHGFGKGAGCDSCDDCAGGVGGEVWSEGELLPQGEDILSPPNPPTPPTFDTSDKSASRWMFPPRLSLFPVRSGE